MLLLTIAVGCSWDIITRGEIHKYESSEISEGILETKDDSLHFRVLSEIEIGEVVYQLVEMEVGELLDGQPGDPDTLLVNHTPGNHSP